MENANYNARLRLTAIRVSSLTKHFGEIRAVDGISFEVKKGELFGFLGPNGAGKTTTQRMLTGILKPDSGTIHIMEFDLGRNPFDAKRIEPKRRDGVFK